MRCKDGQEKWINYWPVILELDNENYLFFAFDITKRVQAEEVIRKSESTLKSVLSSLPVGIAIVNDDRSLEWINQGMTVITGHTPEEMIGRSARMVYATDEEFSRVGRMVYGPVKKGGVGSAETRWLHKDGRMLDIQMFASAVDRNNLSAGMVVSAVDITERKQNEELLFQIFNNSPMAIFILEEGALRMVNSRFEALTGYKKDELLGKDLITLIHPEDMERAWWIEEQTLKDNQETQKPTEYRLITKAGATKTFLEKLTPIIFQGRSALLGNLVDITDRKVLESQLVQAQKLESIGQLAAGIAHEINTPTQFVSDNIHFLQDSFSEINTFLCQLEALIREQGKPEHLLTRFEELQEELDLSYLKEEIPKALGQAREGIERITKIVQAMREFSHPGTKDKALVDINRALQNTLTITRNEWKYVAEVETEFDSALPMIACLHEEMNQVFLNIIVNASQALAEEGFEEQRGMGMIKVSTHLNGQWAEIRISDTGPGIPEALITRIFDPFFTTKEVGKGTGQGLAIARSIIVDKHQGMLWCESEPDKGSTFIIRLPVDEKA